MMKVYRNAQEDNTTRDAATLEYLLNFKRGIKSQWRLDRGECVLHQINDPRLLAYTYETEVPHSKLLTARRTTYSATIPIQDYVTEGIRHVVVEWLQGEVLTIWGNSDKHPYSTSVFFFLFASQKSKLYLP